MARIKPGRGQLGLFDSPEGKAKEGPTASDSKETLEQRAVLNNEPGFGLMSEGVPEKMANLFRMRVEPKLHDHLNFRLIKGAFSGFHQMEYGPQLGIPSEIFQNLDTPDIVSLCFGIDCSKKREPGTGSLKFPGLISYLVGMAYNIESEVKGARNAVRAMKSAKLGFAAHSGERYIKRQMEAVDESAKIQFLRSFHSQRFYSQETYPVLGADFHDPVFAYFNSRGKPVDSNASRDMYVERFIDLVAQRQSRGNDFDTGGFRGFIVPSSSDPENKEYFVEKTVPYSRKPVKARYSCTCDYFENKRRECRHIRSVK